MKNAAKNPDNCTIFTALSTSTPPANSVANVLAMGPVTTGQLCQCRGDVTPPTGSSFDALYFKVARGTATLTSQQVVDAPDAIKRLAAAPGVSTPWNMDGQVPADCNAAGTAQNTLYVVSRSFTPDPNAAPYYYRANLESNTTPFKGKSVSTCGGMTPPGPGPTPTPTTASSSLIPASLSLGSVDAHPTDSDGPWLKYGGLTVQNFYYGNRLMRRGSPLSARLLAVYATDIDWSFELPLNLGRRSINRATGDLQFEPARPSPWRFQNSPTNAIILWQQGLGLPEQVVAAQSREQADIFQVRMQEDVLVQINYHGFFQSTLQGTFSLWVKVID
ncbi:MAG: hypothetical protein ACKV0T_03510 [Planctomycetales bacterium]